jgi:hypothetical protein
LKKFKKNLIVEETNSNTETSDAESNLVAKSRKNKRKAILHQGSECRFYSEQMNAIKYKKLKK